MRARFGAGRCAWVAVACSVACSSPVPLATLRQKSGAVERDWAAQVRAWKVADVGTTFHLGDGLQTHTGASAQLALDDGSQLSLDADTQVRFSDTPPEKHALGFDVETGAASLQAAAEPLSIHTRVGLARIDPGATVVFSHSDEGTRIVVEVGRAVFGDAAEPLTAGAGVRVLPDGDVKRLDSAAPTAAAVSSTSQPSPPSEPSPAEAAPDGLAITARVRGRGASVKTGQGWSSLAEGAARLTPGTELRLARKTSVELEHGRERAQLQTGQYVIAPRAGVLVEASEGSLAAGSEVVVRIAVPGGEIVVAPTGLVNVSLGSGGTLLDVKAKEASIESNGEPQQIRAGQRATLTSSGELSIQGRGLEHADVEIEAGESLTIHDPAPPTAVRFRFAGVCPELGVLQLRSGRAGQYAVGEGAVSLALGRGTQRYELRCGTEGGKVVKQGTLSVLSDDGSRRVAARAPATTLAADGHRYTVLYQNRLPVITLTWPDGPAGTALELTHSFAGNEEKLATNEPRHTFESGSLRDGRHDFSFTGGGKLSRHTRVDIQFDNAAPTATLDAPPAQALEPGDPLTISGIALPGWQVQVGQRRAPQDDQGRFSLPTNWPSDTRAVAVRLSHPERGTHVYVRRPAPSARAGRSP